MSSNISVSDLSTAILAIIEPYTSALDADHHENVAGKDTGSTAPSKQDFGIRILLDGWISHAYRQMSGQLTGSNGNRIDNQRERLQTAEHNLNAHINRYKDENGEPDWDRLTTDPRTYTLEKALEIATQRYNMYETAYTEMCEVWMTLFNEQWRPRDVASTRVNTSDDAKAKLLEKLKAKHGASFVKKTIDTTVAA